MHEEYRMVKVLVPIAGNSSVAEKMGYPYPSSLIELGGRPMIERVIENLSEIIDDGQFIFILREDDCRRFHLDSAVKLLTKETGVVIKLKNETKGALCSVLMAVHHINDEDNILVSNADQLFDSGVLSGFLQEMRSNNADSGSPVFDSVHPRWSYMRIDGGKVVQVAEKDPISRNAIAGLYYFKSGNIFVDAAKRAILNGRGIEGQYFLSAVMSELILDNRNVRGIPIANDKYHSFFTPQRIEEYERVLQQVKPLA